MNRVPTEDMFRLNFGADGPGGGMPRRPGISPSAALPPPVGILWDKAMWNRCTGRRHARAGCTDGLLSPVL